MITGEVVEKTLSTIEGITQRPRRQRKQPARGEDEGYATKPNSSKVTSQTEGTTNKEPTKEKTKTAAEKREAEEKRIKARAAKIVAERQKARAERENKKQAKKKAQVEATIERLGRIAIQPATTGEYIEETESETILREEGQKAVTKLKDLLGRHFIHDGTLYEIVFIYWDQDSNKIAALRRN